MVKVEQTQEQIEGKKQEQAIDNKEEIVEANESGEVTGATEEAMADGSKDKEDSSAELQAQLEEAQSQVSNLNDQILRGQAELQNFRKRAERDVENAHKFALERFGSELLPIVDNLERALDSVDLDNEAAKAMAEGVDLTRKHFIDILKKFKFEQIDPIGEPFDPAFHEAMSMVDAPDAEPNSVINVVQKGFTLNGRVIRAAMVVIAKPVPKIDAQA